MSWHHHHMHMLDRLSRSGVAWAHDALKAESPSIWVAAGGFTPAFEAAVRATRRHVILRTLEDVYRTWGRRVQGRAPSGLPASRRP